MGNPIFQAAVRIGSLAVRAAALFVSAVEGMSGTVGGNGLHGGSFEAVALVRHVGGDKAIDGDVLLSPWAFQQS